MSIGLYDTLVQIKAVELIQLPMEFLFKTFVVSGGNVTEEEMLWDYRKGGVRAAPFVSPRVGGVVMEREGFQTNRIQFSTIRPKRIIETDMLAKRAFGEQLLGTKTPDERAKRLMAGDLKFLKEAIQVRRCAMVADLLNTGRIEIAEWVEGGKISPATKEVDYNFTNRVTVTAPWNTASGDPNTDMFASEQLVREGMGVPTFHLMRSITANALLNNDRFYKQLDNRRMALGSIDPAYKAEPGLRYIGTNMHGIEMYAYDGYFEDYKVDPVTGNVIGTEKRYFLNEGEVICAAPKLITMYHGPVTQIDKDGSDPVTYAKPEVPKVFKDAKTDTISQELCSRPMFVPINVDAWAILEGVLG